MESFASQITGFHVPQGKLGVFFLGQAGFVFKTDQGKLIAVDPYLSDCCNRYFGFRRMIAKLLQPYDLIFDLLLATHAHYDHFDVDAAPMLLDNGITALIAAKDVKAECDRLGLKGDLTFLKVGDSVERCGVKIKAIFCDHGPETPDAVGFRLQFGNITVCMTGDARFRPDLPADPDAQNADLLILPINGAYGNLNAHEAVETAKRLHPALTVPCHFGNFAEHGGNPMEFQKEAGDAKLAYRIMRQGEVILLGDEK